MASKLDKNTLKGIRLNGQIIPSTTDNVQVQARYVQVAPTSESMEDSFGIPHTPGHEWISGENSNGCANNLYDVLLALNGKITSIGSPLNFRGVIGGSGGETLPSSGMKIGDVYLLGENKEIDGVQYYKGDEIVYVSGTGADKAWELIGRNIVSVSSIPVGEITIGNLENTSTI